MSGECEKCGEHTMDCECCHESMNMEWIKCSDRLPEEGQTVLCYRKVIVTGWHCKSYCKYEKKRKGWHCDWDGIARSTFKRYPVTHWMPLPEPPNQ